MSFEHILWNAQALNPSAMWLKNLHDHFPWATGVDVFFVISGFVIVYSSGALFGAPGAMSAFAIRRLARVVPLYWLTTTLFLVISLTMAHQVNGTLGGLSYILASYLFIPSTRPDGIVQPVFGLGWTLNYEMLFYLVFVFCLRWRRGYAVLAASAVLALLTLVPHPAVTVLRFWGRPIVLEFCCGMLLALAAGKIVLSDAARLALGFAAIMFLAVMPPASGLPVHGGAATALVAAATLGRRSHTPPGMVEQWIMRLGEASYMLYLTHPFVMRAVALGFSHAHLHGYVVFYLLSCLVIAQAAAVALHYGFERRMNAAARRILEALFSEMARLWPMRQEKDAR
ncbi:acyltransferase [Gluconacetobacter takamatsuzukensis]|uniref:Acyltransferase n=1 Tax=Gluconacetobacter takamatsuzukensis TaxID=1286190 RepID=A0A7W4KC85_9PROT|nr:acyltransferase [Gluconacetobacter takamatsuzukensis]